MSLTSLGPNFRVTVRSYVVACVAHICPKTSRNVPARSAPAFAPAGPRNRGALTTQASNFQPSESTSIGLPWPAKSIAISLSSLLL